MTKKTPIPLYLAFLFGAKLHHDDWLCRIGYDSDTLDDVTGFERTEAARMILERPGFDPIVE